MARKMTKAEKQFLDAFEALLDAIGRREPFAIETAEKSVHRATRALYRQSTSA